MIKFFSFVLFGAAMVWSWFLFHSQPTISLATHAGIQSKFIQLIESSVKAARPNSTQFEILNIYTQKIDDNQVSAHFTYRYTDQIEEQEKVQQVMSGEAVLARGLAENPEEDRWVIKSVKTDNNSLEYQQGITVNPDTPAASAIASQDGTATH